MMYHPRSTMLLFLLMAMMSCTSCILGGYTSDSSRNKGWIDVSKIKPGTTTKEDFFLEFGNTFKTVSDDEKLFTSTFSKSGEFHLLILIPPGRGLLYTNDYKDIDVYRIQIEFDENDVVKRCDVFKH